MTAQRPGVAGRVVDVHLVRGVRCIPAAAHDPHLEWCRGQLRVGKRLSLACGPRYARNRGDRISYRVIRKRIVAIMDRGTVPGAASGHVNQVTDCCCRYITEWNRQVGALLHPRVSSRSKLPNRVGHRRVDPEPAQDVELVIEHCEAARQSYPISVARPGRRNGADGISDRVVAEYAVSSSCLPACRAADAVDVVRS